MPDEALVKALFHHLALPSQLPSKREANFDKINDCLTDIFLHASQTLNSHVPNEGWDSIRFDLQTCKSINKGGYLNRTALSDEFHRLSPGKLLILHLEEQNAALLVRVSATKAEKSVVFEAFEASAHCESVLASQNALQWDFPERTVVLPAHIFTDSRFQSNLASFLEQASNESIKTFAAAACKAGIVIPEYRDTADPSLITQMLMSLLEANGSRVFPPVLRKRVRDDVYWTDGAEKPWRRSSRLLILKVAVQRQLCTLHGAIPGQIRYKVLVALMLTQFIDENFAILSPGAAVFLQKKLARRLFKLEKTVKEASQEIRESIQPHLASLRMICRGAMRKVTVFVNQTWDHYKAQTLRRVPRFYHIADDFNLVHTLPNCLSYLERIVQQEGEIKTRGSHKSYSAQDMSAIIPRKFLEFAKNVIDLAQQELAIEDTLASTSSLPEDCEDICITLSETVTSYIIASKDMYAFSPEEKSRSLLQIMELWVSMDRTICQAYPLVLEYNPSFPSTILESLQLFTLTDMQRLQIVEDYLIYRHTRCDFSTRSLFHEPSKGCFAERFFDEFDTEGRLNALLEENRASCASLRKQKEEEWEAMTAEFEELERSIAASKCLFMVGPYEKTIHDDQKCTRCYLQRKSRRIRIDVHEESLPSDPVMEKTVVFELGCPEAFAIYRDCTRTILMTLAQSELPAESEPRVILNEYSQLVRTEKNAVANLTLASTTKSFLSTHYRGLRFPVSLDQVCKPNPLKWKYFDNGTKSWVNQPCEAPTFLHHCHLQIPADSLFFPLRSLQPKIGQIGGPSSYEIMSTQTRCPAGVNVHEFLAFQSLTSGSFRRWPTLLLELGSSTINFSNEAVAQLITYVALQSGPRHGQSVFRTAHNLLQDWSFGDRLLQQIHQRLNGIAHNWRESNCMDILVTLTLRIFFLGDRNIATKAAVMLDRIRNITHDWVLELRRDGRFAETACSPYAINAALLFKRTLKQYTDVGEKSDYESLNLMITQKLIECSIALQDCLTGDPLTYSPKLRTGLIQDLKLMFQLHPLIRRTILADPEPLYSAINTMWPRPTGADKRLFSPPAFRSAPHEGWVDLQVLPSESHPGRHTICYDMLQGHLAVNGVPMGKLPAQHRNSAVLRQLFGDRNIMTHSSEMPGMTYQLAVETPNCTTHIGFRQGNLILRCYSESGTLEYVPPDVFGDSTNFDLPSSLVNNCVHWLDLRNKVVEVRQRPDIWKQKASYWVLHLTSRRVQRRSSYLINSRCDLFKNISRVFGHFEQPYNLTIFQPAKGRLTVDLRRLELSFYIGPNRTFQSHHLRAEIDPNQDAGTWYGLDSKLVLRELRNPRRRWILIPVGSITTHRDPTHTITRIQNQGAYARYFINDVLGRIECPVEPRNLYLKAMLHAYTSFVIPDPLTRRTGNEEAIYCLNSALCQPWAPLDEASDQILSEISDLAPKRVYYPKGLKKMQQVFWSSEFSSDMQCEAYLPLVKSIHTQSLALSTFVPNSLASSLTAEDLKTDQVHDHLHDRSYHRWLLYQRPFDGHVQHRSLPDLLYNPTHQTYWSKSSRNVYEICKSVSWWGAGLCAPNVNLAVVLQNCGPVVQGFDSSFDKILLTDRLGVLFAPDLCPLIRLCLSLNESDKYFLMFLLAEISFRNDVDLAVVHLLLVYATSQELRSIELPNWSEYQHFLPNHPPTIAYLRQLIKPCCSPYPGDERSDLPYMAPKVRRKLEAAEKNYNEVIEEQCDTLASLLISQWPCEEPNLDDFPDGSLINLEQALETVLPEWARLFYNHELSTYLQSVQRVIDKTASCRIPLSPVSPPMSYDIIYGAHFTQDSMTLPKLLAQAIISEDQGSVQPNGLIHRPNTNSSNNELRVVQSGVLSSYQQNRQVLSSTRSSTALDELKSIIRSVSKSKSTVKKHYGEDLLRSVGAFRKFSANDQALLEYTVTDNLESKVANARTTMETSCQDIQQLLIRASGDADWLVAGGLWPCITPVSLLERLRSTEKSKFGHGIKELLLQYALSITQLQRLLRLEDAVLKSDTQRKFDEIRNKGHENWQPSQYPDWILLEVDSNLLIRPDQIDVALATISPSSNSNSVLQMNMGQGKTSCVMPMVAANLADTSRLVRVIVPKSLLPQTVGMLQLRLGGLLGRSIKHIPFSRRTATASEVIQQYYEIHKKTKANSGVIVALPEHILSFTLGGPQRLLDSRFSEAKVLINVQNWMKKKCRDILDECDFTLAVRTQLIYPSGLQTSVDGHPHRWEIAEKLLQLVADQVWVVQNDSPQSIEVVQREKDAFPMIFFLRKNAEEALLSRLINAVLSEQSAIGLTRNRTKAEIMVMKGFISKPVISISDHKKINQIFSDDFVSRQAIYLIRGYLVHRILLLALKKRWNVQYGLHPLRAPIAVPFHAKGVPSEQAEWGHPDVAILLTCLSFLLGGLQTHQLRQSMEHLLKSDDPSQEYDRWVCRSDMPGPLREWNLVNSEDESQVKSIWEHLRYNNVVIEYYLNNFVFPLHAKQFAFKIHASGWDIPNSPDVSNINAQLTTGFSGTNDNRLLMPLTIRQADLPGLSHTNAEVLTYLLQRRNRKCVMAADSRGKHLSETGLLYMLKNENIRILIDAGAQILEMDNLSLAKEWLKVDYEVPAALYFDLGNHPQVLYRNGKTMALAASPYAENLADILVYLDEAHVRGVDLKFPAEAKGALTLGQGQTKDHTVQAAMRLRQLGTTQSIVFFAPPEVYQGMVDLRGGSQFIPITSYDVIRWLLEQTCNGIEQMQPLYYAQGMDFCRRMQAAVDSDDILTSPSHRTRYLEALKQTEKQTLEELYKPRQTLKKGSSREVSQQIFTGVTKELAKFLNQLRKGFVDNGEAVHSSALEEVEQEREVAHEVETVREIQKPIYFSPLRFPGIHDDIIEFAKNGSFIRNSSAYEPVFEGFLSRTSLGQQHGISRSYTSSNLFVSSEFSRTVVLPSSRSNDEFLRPINWILWSPTSDKAIVVIPEEAEALIPLMYTTAKKHTGYLITYAAPITRNMVHFDRFRYFTIPSLPSNLLPPPWLRLELGAFAGRLYFEFEDYEPLKTWLGVEEISTDVSKIEPDTDSTAEANAILESTVLQIPFTAKPLAFLHEWLGLRRKGQDFSHTPMGYLCQSKALTKTHHFFRKEKYTPGTIARPSTTTSNGLASEMDNEQTDTTDDEGNYSENGNAPATNGISSSSESEGEMDSDSAADEEPGEGQVNDSEVVNNAVPEDLRLALQTLHL